MDHLGNSFINTKPKRKTMVEATADGFITKLDKSFNKSPPAKNKSTGNNSRK